MPIDLLPQVNALVARGYGDQIGRLDAQTSTKVKETSDAKGRFGQKIFAGKLLALKTEETRRAFEKELINNLQGKVVPKAIADDLKVCSGSACRIGADDFFELKDVKEVTLTEAKRLLECAVNKRPQTIFEGSDDWAYELDESPESGPPYTNLPRTGESRPSQGYVPSDDQVYELDENPQNDPPYTNLPRAG